MIEKLCYGVAMIAASYLALHIIIFLSKHINI